MRQLFGPRHPPGMLGLCENQWDPYSVCVRTCVRENEFILTEIKECLMSEGLHLCVYCPAYRFTLYIYAV